MFTSWVQIYVSKPINGKGPQWKVLFVVISGIDTENARVGIWI